MPGSRAVTQWGYGMLLLAAGTAGIGLRGIAPDIFTVAVASALLLPASGAARTRATASA